MNLVQYQVAHIFLGKCKKKTDKELEQNKVICKAKEKRNPVLQADGPSK